MRCLDASGHSGSGDDLQLEVACDVTASIMSGVSSLRMRNIVKRIRKCAFVN